MSQMYKTAESVAIGHPDKICDQISDAILDACLTQDPTARAAVETMGGHGAIIVTGELTTTAEIDIESIAKKVYKDCGNNDEIVVAVNVVKQSPEIGAGVDNDGAGDQGIMVGYATSETPEMLPLEVVLSRKLTKAMGARDGKAQITTKNGKVVKVLTSICGDESEWKSDIQKVFIEDIAPHTDPNVAAEDLWMKNPNGEWTIGGFAADTGLTGRKLAVDNYGPNVPIGGGAFSGKDATKVDRSAAYMARRVAVQLLKKRNAKEVTVRIAYAIGVAEPLMAVADIDGVQETIMGYDLRPKSIIRDLQLLQPQYLETAKYGHFGNEFTWDR